LNICARPVPTAAGFAVSEIRNAEKFGVALPSFVKRSAVRRMLGGISNPKLDVLARNGTLPTPIRLSERVVLFQEDELLAAIARLQKKRAA